MVGDGAVRGEVAQVGRKPGCHRRGVERAPLPLDEERPRLVTAQQPEGVGVDRARHPLVAEVPGRAVRRVELRNAPAVLRPRLLGEPAQEPVHAGGVLPTLVRMLESSEPAALKAGARQMTLASLSLEEAREDGDLVLSLGGAARVNAAIVYADNVADPTVGEECEERLRILFMDESEAVRHAAARCWNALKPDELTKRGSLLRAYVQSIGPDGDVTVLTHALVASHEPLPPEVCDLAERAVVSYGPKAGDIRLREAAVAYDLVPLVMRLHEETDDPDLRRRVLDVIDDMLRFGFLG